MPLKILTKFLRYESTRVSGYSRTYDFKYFVRRRDNKNLFD